MVQEEGTLAFTTYLRYLHASLLLPSLAACQGSRGSQWKSLAHHYFYCSEGGNKHFLVLHAARVYWFSSHPFACLPSPSHLCHSLHMHARLPCWHASAFLPEGTGVGMLVTAPPSTPFVFYLPSLPLPLPASPAWCSLFFLPT
jgi:hypothetical protein